MAQAFGVVHVLVSGEATENGLTQQTDKRMAAVLCRFIDFIERKLAEHFRRSRDRYVSRHVAKQRGFSDSAFVVKESDRFQNKASRVTQQGVSNDPSQRNP